MPCRRTNPSTGTRRPMRPHRPAAMPARGWCGRKRFDPTPYQLAIPIAILNSCDAERHLRTIVGIMPRTRIPVGSSIADLERALQRRRAEYTKLLKERVGLERRLGVIDAKLRALGGGRGGGVMNTAYTTASGRARNSQSLVATLTDVMTKANKPLNVGEIVEKVQASGYRSNSINFRALVNQTLIKERKRFSNAGRGLYRIK